MASPAPTSANTTQNSHAPATRVFACAKRWAIDGAIASHDSEPERR